MNIFQKLFLILGIIAIIVLMAFPPQITMSKAVRFLPITFGYPIDWFRFFLWFVAIVFVAVLGIAANKSEHF